MTLTILQLELSVTGGKQFYIQFGWSRIRRRSFISKDQWEYFPRLFTGCEGDCFRIVDDYGCILDLVFQETLQKTRSSTRSACTNIVGGLDKNYRSLLMR